MNPTTQLIDLLRARSLDSLFVDKTQNQLDTTTWTAENLGETFINLFNEPSGASLLDKMLQGIAFGPRNKLSGSVEHSFEVKAPLLAVPPTGRINRQGGVVEVFSSSTLRNVIYFSQSPVREAEWVIRATIGQFVLPSGDITWGFCRDQEALALDIKLVMDGNREISALKLWLNEDNSLSEIKFFNHRNDYAYTSYKIEPDTAIVETGLTLENPAPYRWIITSTGVTFQLTSENIFAVINAEGDVDISLTTPGSNVTGQIRSVVGKETAKATFSGYDTELDMTVLFSNTSGRRNVIIQSATIPDKLTVTSKETYDGLLSEFYWQKSDSKVIFFTEKDSAQKYRYPSNVRSLQERLQKLVKNVEDMRFGQALQKISALALTLTDYARLVLTTRTQEAVTIYLGLQAYIPTGSLRAIVDTSSTGVYSVCISHAGRMRASEKRALAVKSIEFGEAMEVLEIYAEKATGIETNSIFYKRNFEGYISLQAVREQWKFPLSIYDPAAATIMGGLCCRITQRNLVYTFFFTQFPEGVIYTRAQLSDWIREHAASLGLVGGNPKRQLTYEF